MVFLLLPGLTFATADSVEKVFPYSHIPTCTYISSSPSLSHLHTHLHIQNCVRHLVLLLPLFPTIVQNTFLGHCFHPLPLMCLPFPYSEPELLEGWVLFYSFSFSQHLAGPGKDTIDVY